jgi:outer membrane receptor protein involved in Fe transport
MTNVWKGRDAKAFIAVLAVTISLSSPAEAESDPMGSAPSIGASPSEEPTAEPPRTAESAPESTVAKTGDAPAEAPVRGRAIEEIVVTAQKREEALREVPISMAVFSDELLSQNAVSGLEDLDGHVPNLSVESDGISTAVRIRGLGADVVNKGFEQAVGLVLDGLPYEGKEYFNLGFFDLDRVEVLRGPQGTLFGKNTSAGLIQIVSKKPTDEFSGFVDLKLGDFDRRAFEAGIGGPLVKDLVNFRISGYSDERDGFIENTTDKVAAGADDTASDRERRGLRLQLASPNLAGADVLLGYELFDGEFGAFAAELIGEFLTPGTRAFLPQFDPNVDFDRDNFKASQDEPTTFERRINRFFMNAGYDLGGWGLHLTTGHAVLEVDDHFDGDETPAPNAFGDSEDEDPQTTAEFRVASPALTGLLGLGSVGGFGLGTSEVTVGVFYQRRQITDSIFKITVEPGVVGPFVASSMTGVAVPPAPEGTVPPETTTLFFDQTSDSVAGFGQMDWSFLDQWTLTYGMRFTNESKSGEWERTFGGPSPVLTGAAGFEAFTEEIDRSESAFTPKVALKYDWTDAVNLYAGWAKGFRAGGFNEFAANSANAAPFDAETTSAWEIGTKLDLLDGLAGVNLALYRQDVTDLQVLILEPGSFNVGTVRNAAEARAQGVELEYTILPTDWLTVLGALGFTDSEYLSFPNGPCATDMQNTDGDANPGCNLAGESLPWAPEWKHTLTTALHWPLRSLPGFRTISESPLGGLGIGGAFTVEWQDVQILNPTNDPRTRQSSFFRLAANAGIDHVEQGWSLRLVATNLTNENIAGRINEIAGVSGNYFQFTEEPRLIVGELRWEF